MPHLTSRAEEALLGALISDPGQLASIPGITAADFTDPARQAVFTAITALHEQTPDARGAGLAARIAATAGRPEVTSGYLDQITAATPTPAAADVYGRMILEAALDRRLAAHAAEARAAVLAAGHPGRSAILADLIGSLAGNLDAARAAAADTPPLASPLPDDRQALLEERFLAAFMRQPTLTDWVTLDPQVFTSPARRLVYQAIVTADQHGEPVDELTVIWDLAREAAISHSDAGRLASPGELAAAIPSALIARLAATPAGTADGVEAARDLLAARAQAEIAAVTASTTGPAQHAIMTAGRQQAIGSGPLLARPPAPQPGRDTPRQRHEGS